MKVNLDSTYSVEPEDVRALVDIHRRLADESHPLKADERRNLHLQMGNILERFVEDIGTEPGGQK